MGARRAGSTRTGTDRCVAADRTQVRRHSLHERGADAAGPRRGGARLGAAQGDRGGGGAAAARPGRGPRADQAQSRAPRGRSAAAGARRNPPGDEADSQRAWSACSCAMCERAELPRPEVNVTLRVGGDRSASPTSSGVTRADRRSRQPPLPRHRHRPSTSDRRREQRLQLAGWRVSRCTWEQVEHEPASPRRDDPRPPHPAEPSRPTGRKSPLYRLGTSARRRRSWDWRGVGRRRRGFFGFGGSGGQQAGVVFGVGEEVGAADLQAQGVGRARVEAEVVLVAGADAVVVGRASAPAGA